MPTVQENRSRWNTYEWSEDGAEWTTGYGGPDLAWSGTVFPRIKGFLPARHILELGPGHGLWTARLLPYAKRMTLVDVAESCIAKCRSRFRWRRGMRYIVNNGRSLDAVGSSSIDFVFSWHSLVHADHADMQGYITGLKRVLMPGGGGVIHHSNFGVYLDGSGKPGIANEHWRGADMTAEKFRDDCRSVGLACTYQEIVPWGSPALVDCISVVYNVESAAPTVVDTNHGFWDDIQRLHRRSQAYGPTQGVGVSVRSAAMAR